MSKKLMKKNILKAQNEIDDKKNIIKNGTMRQYYHFMAQTGWINDPNGLIYFNGKYHFFYQFNPYGGFWDSMHWGHAISDDMLNWEHLPVAIAPSETYDDYQKGGCFSGSAIEHDGKLFLMYTGCANNGKGSEQVQCIAYSDDGISFEKYEDNPVITAPKGFSKDSFRDPKVWKHEDMFYMVLGASKDNYGMALLYRSEDMYNWSFFNILAESRGKLGYMWECPDFYKLGDRYVLTFSPMGVGDHTSVYLVGDFDYKTGKFDYNVIKEIDWGFDYYAPQSFVAPDGRRIMVGWSNEWDWMPNWKDWGPTFKEGWCGHFNIPLEVSLLENDTLKFTPIKEIENIRHDALRIDDLTVFNDEIELSAGNGISYEVKFKIDLEKTDANLLELNLRVGDGKKTVCILDLAKSEMSVNRNNSDGWSEGISKSVLFLKDKKILDIHIFSDQSSLEIFTNNYKNNHSNNIFAGNKQNKLKLCAHGGKVVINDIETYGLKKTT